MVWSPLSNLLLYGQTADVAGWGNRIANWDVDMSTTYLTTLSDPALGVLVLSLAACIAFQSKLDTPMSALPSLMNSMTRSL